MKKDIIRFNYLLLVIFLIGSALVLKNYDGIKNFSVSSSASIEIPAANPVEDSVISCDDPSDTLAVLLNQPAENQNNCLFVGCNSFF